jgi:hypothetical protein
MKTLNLKMKTVDKSNYSVQVPLLGSRRPHDVLDDSSTNQNPNIYLLRIACFTTFYRTSINAFYTGYRSDMPHHGVLAVCHRTAQVVGRVKIQVYRGPSKGSGYDAVAAHGFYVTQPVDRAPPGPPWTKASQSNL